MRLAEAMNEQATADGPTDLYRYYDRQGRLLYIGISKSAVMRAMQHERTASWWDAWAYMTRQQYPSRTTALAAEYEAIRAEQPVCNIAHSVSNIITLKGQR
jgi:excinuclease UvrABC nuclease subunit